MNAPQIDATIDSRLELAMDWAALYDKQKEHVAELEEETKLQALEILQLKAQLSACEIEYQRLFKAKITELGICTKFSDGSGR